MSNGCGCAKGWLKYFRPPYAKKFAAACAVHDDDYEKGGDAKARKMADTTLFRYMLKIVSREHYDNPFIIMWFAHIALLYYISVRIFGSHYFTYTKE